jgi:hypothetical protein
MVERCTMRDGRTRHRTIACLVACLATGLSTAQVSLARPERADRILAPLPAEVAAEGLREADWDSLKDGGVVARGRTKGDATTEAIQAAGFIVVEAPASAGYAFVARHERRPEYSRCTKAVEILSREEADRGREAVKVRETHKSLWITTRYTVDYTHDPGLREIRWALDPAARNDVRDNRGSWRVIDLGPGRSLAVYRIAGAAGKLPAFLIDYFVRQDLPAFLRAVRKRVEEEARVVQPSTRSPYPQPPIVLP